MFCCRDLKPANLLLKGSPCSSTVDWENVDVSCLQVKIGDFGLSKEITDGTPTLNVGSNKYKAPEVIKGKNYGPKADIFSVAVILFEMEHGRTPSDRDYSMINNFWWLTRSGKVPVCIGREGIKMKKISNWRAHEKLMMRMLQKQPGRRPTADRCLEKLC